MRYPVYIQNVPNSIVETLEAYRRSIN